jgi:hypothetical protein
VPFLPPPQSAAWLHQGLRTGFEVTYLAHVESGYHLHGCTAAIEDGQSWAVSYDIWLDPTWTTHRALISNRTATGTRATVLELDVAGGWKVDGEAAPHLAGCLDVDLESSAMTNALPVHRMDLPVGGGHAPAAAYVRAGDLAVDRLEQTYVRLSDGPTGQRYDYRAPAFEFACELVYDESGLVLEYPGIAARAG